MAVKRPGAVTAASVLSIIYGSLFTLCGVCGIVSLAMQGGMGGGNPFGGGDPMAAQIQDQLMKAIEREAPGYQAYQIVSAVLNLALPVMLLVAAIGLLQMRPWSRTLALITTWLIIANYIAQIVYALAFLFPAMNRGFEAVFANLPGPAPAPPQAIQAMRAVMTMVAVVTVVVYGIFILYLITILILLNLSHVRIAFADVAAGRVEQPEEERYREREPDAWRREDDDWDRPPPAAEGPKDERIQ